MSKRLGASNDNGFIILKNKLELKEKREKKNPF